MKNPRSTLRRMYGRYLGRILLRPALYKFRKKIRDYYIHDVRFSMTDIKVIIDEDSSMDMALLSLEEREILMEGIAHAENIPIGMAKSYMEMQTEVIQTNLRRTKPTLKELLLRKLIQLSQNHGSIFNTVVVPIVQCTTKRIGAADTAPQPGHKPARRNELPPDNMKISFDTPIYCMDGPTTYIAPPGEMINVVGISVYSLCAPPKGIKITSGNMGQRLLTGFYDHNDAGCSKYFNSMFGEPLMFGDKIGTVTKNFDAPLDALFDYFMDIERMRSVMGAQIVYTQIGMAVEHRMPADLQKSLISLCDIKSHHIPIIAGKTVNQPILDILETMHFGRFCLVFKTALLADVYDRGFAPIYQGSVLKGKDSKDVINDISIYKAKKQQTAFRLANTLRLLEEKNRLTVYKQLIEKKLGIAKLKEVETMLLSKPSLLIEAKNVLTLLTPAQKKLIELEFDKRQKYLEAILNNKCPHVKLYRQFRQARDDERIKKSYNDLKKFFNEKSDSMITCKSCGFDIMCPHIRDFTELDLAGKFYTDVKAKLTKYIDKATVKDQYYCKICGELISTLDSFETSEVVHADSMDEDLKNFIWSEIAMLTKYLKFNNMVNVPQLITIARNACYQHIFDIEKQILKSKTNNVETIRAKKKLYTTIYAFAYFIHLILSNKKSNTVDFKNFSAKDPKTLLVNMIRHSMDLILSLRNIAIRQIKGMNADIIKNALVSAYKTIYSAGAQEVVFSNESEDTLTSILLDPVYGYYYIMFTLDKIRQGAKVPTSLMDKVDKLNAVIGGSVESIEKNTQNIYQKAYRVNGEKWGVGYFSNLQKLPRSPAADAYKQAFSGYLARSFELFISRPTSYLYTWNGDLENVTMMPDYSQLHDKYLKFRPQEAKLLGYSNFIHAQTYNFLYNKKPIAKPENVSLARIYDENGRPHVWNIFLVETTADGKLTSTEYKNSDIAAMVESGKTFLDKFSDAKCSVCGILRSTVSTLSEEKIRDSLHALRAVSNFFRFYENRCPVGGLHEFGSSTNCAKCLMKLEFVANSSSSDALSYYRKHKAVYGREKAEFKFHQVEEGVSIATPLTAYPEYDEWSFNFNQILDLATKLKINHRLLSAIGSMEKQEYDDVLTGAFIPLEPEERTSTKIFVMSSYVKNLFTEYNMLKNFHKLHKPSAELLGIIDESAIPKHKLFELGKVLPDIFNDYNARFNYFKRSKKPRDIFNFCLGSLCEKCLIILDDKSKETEKLRQLFVEYFIKKILRGEELFTKPGYFNWSSLYNEKEKISDGASKVHIDEDIDDGDAADNDTGDTSAPMANNFDMEDGDDWEENDVKVGESLGMD